MKNLFFLCSERGGAKWFPLQLLRNDFLSRECLPWKLSYFGFKTLAIVMATPFLIPTLNSLAWTNYVFKCQCLLMDFRVLIGLYSKFC